MTLDDQIQQVAAAVAFHEAALNQARSDLLQLERQRMQNELAGMVHSNRDCGVGLVVEQRPMTGSSGLPTARTDLHAAMSAPTVINGSYGADTRPIRFAVPEDRSPADETPSPHKGPQWDNLFG